MMASRSVQLPSMARLSAVEFTVIVVLCAPDAEPRTSATTATARRDRVRIAVPPPCMTGARRRAAHRDALADATIVHCASGCQRKPHSGWPLYGTPPLHLWHAAPAH